MSEPVFDSASPSPETVVLADVFPLEWLSTPLRPWSGRREVFFMALADHVRRHATQFWTAGVELELESLAVVEATMRDAFATSLNLDAAALEAEVDALIDWSRFASAAGRVLWLASMEPAKIRSLAPDAMLSEIEVWMETHLPDSMLRQAVRLAIQLRTAYRDLVVLPRPHGGSGKGEKAGN